MTPSYVRQFSKKTKWLLLAGALVATIYFVRGFYHLAFNQGGGASDLRYRKVELHYFLNGQNPYEVFLANAYPFSQSRWNFEGRNTSVNPSIGVGAQDSLPGYPPWAFPVIAATLWPAWPAVRYYFAFLNLLALVAIGWSILQLYPGPQKERGWLVMTACLMTSTFCMTLGVGQFGIIVMAGLFLSLVFESRPRPAVASYWAGLGLAIGFMKPTMGLPFVIPLLFKGRWRPAATAAAFAVVFWTVTALVTKTPPFVLVQEWLTASAGLWAEGDGPIHIAGSWGVSQNVFTAIVIAGTTALLWWLRHEPLVVLFGLASVGARFWTYHRFYDNILLVFLLLAYCQRLFGRIPSKSFWCGFALLAISLWPPASAFFVLTNEFQYLAWVTASAWLVYHCRALKDW